MLEFLPKYPFQEQKPELIDRLLAGEDNFKDILDEYARVELLAHALVMDKDYKVYAQSSTRDTGKKPAGLRKFILDGSYTSFLERIYRTYGSLFLTPTLPDLSIFPPGSWMLQLTFKLKKSYLSRDDIDLYIIDNPVKKEWVFKLPYVAASQWKGSLHSAMVQILANEVKDSQKFSMHRFFLSLIFGDEKGEQPLDNLAVAKFLDETHPEAKAEYREMVEKAFRKEDKASEKLPSHSGRLQVYPTYFKRIGLEIINPHDRLTGAGKDPIQIECVPPDTEGTFQLLYVPLDIIGSSDIAEQAMRDLVLVVEGVAQMFTLYGFGAKTSSGFGIAENQISNGQLWVYSENQGKKPVAYNSFDELIDKAKGERDATRSTS